MDLGKVGKKTNLRNWCTFFDNLRLFSFPKCLNISSNLDTAF